MIALVRVARCSVVACGTHLAKAAHFSLNANECTFSDGLHDVIVESHCVLKAKRWPALLIPLQGMSQMAWKRLISEVVMLSPINFK